ncbi:MAG: pentapeptide repeat-containing protein [Cyanobacteria bacterium P01_A01_bin.84]
MTNTSKKPSDNLLGELIKRIRTTNNLTQGNFGKIFKPSVTQSTVARWEKGELTPDMMHFPKIASLLNLSYEELIEFIEKPTSTIEDLDIENKTLTYNKRHLSMLKKGVRTWNNWREKNPNIIPQLSGIHLFAGEGEFYNLDGYNLERANLAGLKGNFIQLKQANLVEANLEKAQLEGGSFVGSNFSGANLNKIDIKDTRFDRAIFKETNLSKANIYYSDFKEVTFEKAYMEKAVFTKVDLTGAKFKQANLESSQFINVKLREANLNEASLKKAKLSQCSIYGSTFIKTNIEDIKTDNIFVSPDGFEGIPINNLAQAQYTYLQRYHPLLTQKFVGYYNLETEIVKYSQILVNKYGDYRYKEKFSLFATHRGLNIIPPFVNIFKDDNCLYTEILPDYNARNLQGSGTPERRKILEIKNNLVESSFSIEDLDVLKLTFEYIQKEQKQKFNRAISIAKKILASTKKNNFANQNTTIEKLDNEIIICEIANGFEEDKTEIVRGKIIDNQLEMIRSAIYDNHLINIQNILLNLVM